MRTELDPSTAPAPAPGNLFAPEFLALLSPCEDEPVPAAEAAASEPVPDPWHLEPHPLEPGWAVLPQGKSMFTTQPHASFQNIDFARLAAAVLPSTEQPPPVPPRPRARARRSRLSHLRWRAGRGALQIFR